MPKQITPDSAHQVLSLLADLLSTSSNIARRYQLRADTAGCPDKVRQQADAISDLNQALAQHYDTLQDLFNDADQPRQDFSYTGYRHHRGGKTVNQIHVHPTRNPHDQACKRELQPHPDTPGPHRPFSWAAGNIPGATATATAILADFAGPNYARIHSQTFMREVIFQLPWREWSITTQDLAAWTYDHPTHLDRTAK